MIEEEIKGRFDYLEARLDTVEYKMDKKLDETAYSPVVSELDIIRNDIADLRMLLDRLNTMIEHEREQRKKFMIALVEAGEEGLF
jgi:predicted  nucleic acid-binding Zn-ribbon protein